MKKTTFAIFVFGLAVLSGCNMATNAGAEKNASHSNTEPLRSNVNVTNTPSPPVHQSKSKQPLIWIGSVSFDKTALESSGSFSENNAVEEEFPGGAALGTTVEVDVMNCAGFLTTAKLIYLDEGGEGGFPPGWELKVISEKVAADARERINLCHNYSEYPYSSNVFAVAPQDSKRKGVKIGKADTRKLFASLDKETKEMANTTEKYVGREKNNLTLSNDNWADIDGDGQIDLVKVSGNCGNKDYTCTLVFLLINGKWEKVGDIGPA